MELIDFCKHPPECVTIKNVFNYTNFDFTHKAWPINNYYTNSDPETSDSIYINIHSIKHICNNIINIYASNELSFNLFLRACWSIGNIVLTKSAQYIIDNKYYLHSGEHNCYNGLIIDFSKTLIQYANQQQYIKSLVIDNPNYFPKNIIKHNDMLCILMWTFKYQKIFPKLLFKHKIIPSVYS